MCTQSCKQWAMAMTVTTTKPEWSPIGTNNEANAPVKATASQRKREEEDCPAVPQCRGHPPGHMERSACMKLSFLSRCLCHRPCILFIFCSFHTATGIQQLPLANVCRGSKGLLVPACPQAWAASGDTRQSQNHHWARGSGVKVHRRSEQMLGSLSKSLNICGLLESDHVNFD